MCVSVCVTVTSVKRSVIFTTVFKDTGYFLALQCMLGQAVDCSSLDVSLSPDTGSHFLEHTHTHTQISTDIHTHSTLSQTLFISNPSLPRPPLSLLFSTLSPSHCLWSVAMVVVSLSLGSDAPR